MNDYRKMCSPNLKTLSDLTIQVFSCKESSNSCLCSKMLFVQDCLLSKIPFLLLKLLHNCFFFSVESFWLFILNHRRNIWLLFRFAYHQKFDIWRFIDLSKYEKCTHWGSNFVAEIFKLLSLEVTLSGSPVVRT